MKKQRLNLRNVVAIAICLTATASIFLSCRKEPDNTGDANTQITYFALNSKDLPSPAVGVIHEDKKYINVVVPFNTDARALVPTITVSKGAKVTPASGVAQNFIRAINHPGKDMWKYTQPVKYTVTGKNGKKSTYDVCITESYEGGGGLNVDGYRICFLDGASYHARYSVNDDFVQIELHQGWIWGDQDGGKNGRDMNNCIVLAEEIPGIIKADTLCMGYYEGCVGAIMLGGKYVYVGTKLTLELEYLPVDPSTGRICSFHLNISGTVIDPYDTSNPPKEHVLDGWYVGPVWWSGI